MLGLAAGLFCPQTVFQVASLSPLVLSTQGLLLLLLLTCRCKDILKAIRQEDFGFLLPVNCKHKSAGSGLKVI